MVLDRIRNNQFIIFLLLPLFINGQENNIEKTAINTPSHGEHDCTSLFNDYLSLSQFHREKSLDSASYYAEEALRLAVRMNENDKIAKAYQNRGFMQLAFDNSVAAKKNITLAKTYYHIDNDSTAAALMNLDLGDSYYYKDDLNQSLYNFLSAYDFFKSKEPSDKFVETLGKIGRIYSDLGMIKKSHEFQTLSLQVSKKLRSPHMIMASKNRMALLFSKQNEYIEASKCFNEAIKLGLDNKSFVHELLIAYNGLADVLYKTDNYVSSLKYATKALAIVDSQKPSVNSIYVYIILGKSHMGLKNYSKSESYLLNANDLIGKITSEAAVSIECHQSLYRLYEKINKPKKALHHYKRFVQIKDSVFSKEVNQKITQLESERLLVEQNKAYSKLKLKVENEKLLHDSKLKNIFTISAIVFAALLCLFLFFFYRNKEVKSEAKLQLAQNKFDSLRSQMNPHFIFNVINGVQNYILKAEKYEAYNHLTTFANAIRLVLNNSWKSFISLENEIELIKTYIDLEKVRFRNDFEYTINIDKKLNISNLLIPSMIIQPIVENAIIHGLSNKQDSGELYIDFKLADDQRFVICQIKDNGIGRAEAIKIKESTNQEAHLSIATINAEQRIQLLKKMGYKKSQINIVDLTDENQKPAGTEVILCLPIKIK